MIRNEPAIIPERKIRKETRYKTYIPVKVRRQSDPDFVIKRYLDGHEHYLKYKDSMRLDGTKNMRIRREKFSRFKKDSSRISAHCMAVADGRTKVCTKCERTLGTSFFDKQRDKAHKKGYRRTYCFDCRKKMNAAAYIKRKERLLNDT